MNDDDLLALATSARLAAVTTAVLFLLGTPLAWWLARGRSRARSVVEALIAVPLVLPPTVLGFYLLRVLSPQGLLGEWLGDVRLVFTFEGLVIGSCVFSLPFVVQPLRDSFAAIDPRLLDVAATLGAGPLDRFRSVVLPLSRPGLVTAGVLGFAHTVGEFGVVWMLGGNVPGETRVASIAVFEAVERMEYGRAHVLSAVLVALSFVTLLIVQRTRRRVGR